MLKYYLNRFKETAQRLLRTRLRVLIFLFCVLFTVLIGRLFYLQIVKGEYYEENYTLQIRKTQSIPGIRGNIYDRNGELLAYNELAYSVTFEDTLPTEVNRNETLNQIMEGIIDIVESNGDSVVSDFGIILDSAGNYQFTQTDQTSRLRFIADVYGQSYVDDLTEAQRTSTAADIIHYLCTDDLYGFGIDDSALPPEHVLKLVTMRYDINLNSYQKYISTTLASDVSDKTAAAIMENKDTLIGVDISEEYLRRYKDSQYFSTIIGYTGKISQEEYDELDDDEKERYSLSDIIGKAGIEQSMDSTLQGDKGELIVYVDSVGNVTDTVSYTESDSGNDIYLSIDKDLQEQTYHILEEKLAGIVLSKLANVMNYDPSAAADSSDIIIPIDDAYNAFIANEIIDSSHFSSDDAGPSEQEVYTAYMVSKDEAINAIMSELNGNGTPYQDLSLEMQAYMEFVSDDLLRDSAGILSEDDIDTSDETYQAWAKEETISLSEFLKYAISQNWINTSILSSYMSAEKYSDATEIYQAIVQFVADDLSSDAQFNRLIYKYLIKTGRVSGGLICSIVYEQGVLPMDEGNYNGLRDGSVDAYNWLYTKIANLEITPGQLALEPCTASAVVADPNTGEVLACVSYPGYDNNRLTNTMDSDYYNRLVSGLSNPFYNTATQEETAPGSTYKMVTAVAGLTEGILTADTYLNCSGIFEEVTPSPRCWIYPGSHGALNVTNALAVSCNCFFYGVGYQLSLNNGLYDSDQGVAAIAKYAEEFGLGEPSGVEIPESDPQISDNYAVETAIGQGTNNYTVTQLCRYVSTVANKGTVYKFTLLDKITDSNGKTLKQYGSNVSNTMDEVSDETWELVQEGMAAMVSNSTTFSGMGMAMGGKTGTAQQSDVHADHALFVGYAPADKPEIALAVRIANGYNSLYASEVGRDIVRAKFGLSDMDDIITGSAAKLGSSTAGD